MFVTNWISTTKIQKISEITNFFRHYFLSRTEVIIIIFFSFFSRLVKAESTQGDTSPLHLYILSLKCTHGNTYF